MATARRRGRFLRVAQWAAVVLVGAAAAARADGAIAVGSTGDVVKYGIAFGFAVDVPSKDAATTALTRCQSFEAREAAKLCKVVATFSRQCYAVAYDPEPGTPGAGWGIGKDQTDADEKALSMCRATAGTERETFCQVDTGGCDTRN